MDNLQAMSIKELEQEIKNRFKKANADGLTRKIEDVVLTLGEEIKRDGTRFLSCAYLTIVHTDDYTRLTWKGKDVFVYGRPDQSFIIRGSEWEAEIEKLYQHAEEINYARELNDKEQYRRELLAKLGEVAL